VGTVLPTDLKPVLFDTALLVPPSWHAYPDSIDVATLRKAIREQHKVRLNYQDEAGALTERVIWPIAISYFDAQRLIVAWCELRQDYRTFRTDRMARAEVLPMRYVERRKVLLKRWMEQEHTAGRSVQGDVFM
jgi:predicted DNA-binding transcriptional regulator YafY